MQLNREFSHWIPLSNDILFMFLWLLVSFALSADKKPFEHDAKFKKNLYERKQKTIWEKVFL